LYCSCISRNRSFSFLVNMIINDSVRLPWVIA
jgi:hypothetical protein